ncbi:MAG: tRNA pseudouridine(55) synthase TruB [Solirubrobacteraceae bacterium]
MQDGVLPVDKLAGITSHDVVARVRRSLGARRVGHAGTLDPFATGLLLVLVGRATRAQRFLVALPKTYVVVARLGAVSSTGDPEGEITNTGRVPCEPLALPTGVLSQRPPAYSAVKVGGERAYRRARRGEEVEIAERTVVVHRFEALWRDGDRAGFEIECSAGTYVRSLIADLGDAYCEELRRTRIGPFAVEEAVPPPERAAPAPERVAPAPEAQASPPETSAPGALASAPERTLDDRIVPLGDALAFLPERRLCGKAARAAAHGRAVPGEAVGIVRLVDDDGIVALAEPRDGGLLKPIVGFRG